MAGALSVVTTDVSATVVAAGLVLDDVDDDPQAAPNKHNVIPSDHRCRSRIHNLRSCVHCEAVDTKGTRDFGQHFVRQ